MEALITAISSWIVELISRLGYGGVILGMAIESACIPLPSEIIMPFSGYLVSRGQFDLVTVGLAGAFGNLLGSWVAYFVGYLGGRPLLEQYGRYLLIRPEDLQWADRWFSNYGEETALFSRLLPVVRTFISLPAGIARMPLGRFSLQLGPGVCRRPPRGKLENNRPLFSSFQHGGRRVTSSRRIVRRLAPLVRKDPVFGSRRIEDGRDSDHRQPHGQKTSSGSGSHRGDSNVRLWRHRLRPSPPGSRTIGSGLRPGVSILPTSRFWGDVCKKLYRY